MDYASPALSGLDIRRRNTMDFGITVATAADSWKVVKRAEELGFTYAWFYDTQMLNADPFVDMAEYIRVVQGLLRQETLEWDYAGQRRTIRFLNPELELINLADAIPFYISAFGPRGKALAARLGTGWIYGVRNAAQAVGQLQAMQQAWREAGRDPSALYAIAQGSGCVLAEGEAYDSPRAKAQAGPTAVMVMHDLA